MKDLSATEKRQLLQELVTDEVVAEYLLGDRGESLGFYPQNKSRQLLVGTEVGMEADPDACPVFTVPCPGFREDWFLTEEQIRPDGADLRQIVLEAIDFDDHFTEDLLDEMVGAWDGVEGNEAYEAGCR
jgi:hypothetical protein